MCGQTSNSLQAGFSYSTAPHFGYENPAYKNGKSAAADYGVNFRFQTAIREEGNTRVQEDFPLPGASGGAYVHAEDSRCLPAERFALL